MTRSDEVLEYGATDEYSEVEQELVEIWSRNHSAGAVTTAWDNFEKYTRPSISASIAYQQEYISI